VVDSSYIPRHDIVVILYTQLPDDLDASAAAAGRFHCHGCSPHSLCESEYRVGSPGLLDYGLG